MSAARDSSGRPLTEAEEAQQVQGQRNWARYLETRNTCRAIVGLLRVPLALGALLALPGITGVAGYGVYYLLALAGGAVIVWALIAVDEWLTARIEARPSVPPNKLAKR